MPALSAFADILDKAADLLVDPAITSDELCNRGLPGQSGAENKLLTRTRDQVVKRFGPNDVLRVDVETFLRELSKPLPQPELLEQQRTYRASLLSAAGEYLREFAATRLKEAKKLRRLRKRAGGKRRTSQADTKAPWCHRHDEAKPEWFCFGPLTGTADELDAATCQRKTPDPNHRQLKRRGTDGHFWIVRRRRTCFEVWFPDEGSYRTAKRRLGR